jgi:hypothetical protein
LGQREVNYRDKPRNQSFPYLHDVDNFSVVRKLCFVPSAIHSFSPPQGRLIVFDQGLLKIGHIIH